MASRRRRSGLAGLGAERLEGEVGKRKCPLAFGWGLRVLAGLAQLLPYLNGRGVAGLRRSVPIYTWWSIQIFFCLIPRTAQVAQAVDSNCPAGKRSRIGIPFPLSFTGRKESSRKSASGGCRGVWRWEA